MYTQLNHNAMTVNEFNEQYLQFIELICLSFFIEYRLKAVKFFGCCNCKPKSSNSETQCACGDKKFTAKYDIFKRDGNKIANWIRRIERKPFKEQMNEETFRQLNENVKKLLQDIEIYHIGNGN